MPWRAWSPKGAFFARCPRSFSRFTCGWSWLSRRLLVATDRQTSGCPQPWPDGVASWHFEKVRTNNSRRGNKVTLRRIVMKPLPLAGVSFFVTSWQNSLKADPQEQPIKTLSWSDWPPGQQGSMRADGINRQDQMQLDLNPLIRRGCTSFTPITIPQMQSRNSAPDNETKEFCLQLNTTRMSNPELILSPAHNRCLSTQSFR